MTYYITYLFRDSLNSARITEFDWGLLDVGFWLNDSGDIVGSQDDSRVYFIPPAAIRMVTRDHQ